MAKPGQVVIISSGMSIAQDLWRFGEPGLADRMLPLSPELVADIGERAGAMYIAGEVRRHWPAAPASEARAALVLVAIAEFEGRPRPPARGRRLRKSSLPSHLTASDEDLWKANNEVAKVVERRRHRPGASNRFRSAIVRRLRGPNDGERK
jgi:hypothetical protein